MNIYQMAVLLVLYVLIAVAAYIEHRYNQSTYLPTTWFIGVFVAATITAVLAGSINLYAFLGAL
jgi:hypothetical protein